MSNDCNSKGSHMPKIFILLGLIIVMLASCGQQQVEVKAPECLGGRPQFLHDSRIMEVSCVVERKTSLGETLELLDFNSRIIDPEGMLHGAHPGDRIVLSACPDNKMAITAITCNHRPGPVNWSKK